MPAKRKKLLTLSAKNILASVRYARVAEGVHEDPALRWLLASSRQREARLRQARKLLLPKLALQAGASNDIKPAGTRALSAMRQCAAGAWRVLPRVMSCPFRVPVWEHTASDAGQRHVIKQGFPVSLFEC